MATTYRTKQSKYWFARFHDGSGKRISKTTKTESRREAKRIAADFEAQARKAEKIKERDDQEIPRMIRRTLELAGLEMQAGRLTLQRAEELIRQMHAAASPEDSSSNFRRFAGQWLDGKEQTTAAGTYRVYSDAIKSACSILGTKAEGPLRSITVGDMENLQGTMAKTRRGKTTNNAFGCVRRILESAVRKDIIQRNPAKDIRDLPLGDSIKRLEFSTAEVQRLLAAAPSAEWRGLILLGAQTGLRQGDLLRLSADNVVNNRIHILPQKTSKESNEVLQIPLRPEAMAWLEGRTGALFPEIQAIDPKVRPKRFRAVMEAAGVAHEIVLAAGDPPTVGTRSFHSLRHSFASWMAEKGVASDVRQRLTGHKTDSIHAKYSHHNAVLDNAIATLPAL